MTTFNPNDIPSTVFDWDETKKTVGGSEDITKRITQMLATSLIEILPDIKTAYEAMDFEILKQRTHKLHGGLCYVCAPQLRYLTERFERFATIKDQRNVELIYDHFTKAVQALLLNLNETH